MWLAAWVRKPSWEREEEIAGKRSTGTVRQHLAVICLWSIIEVQLLLCHIVTESMNHHAGIAQQRAVHIAAQSQFYAHYTMQHCVQSIMSNNRSTDLKSLFSKTCCKSSLSLEGIKHLPTQVEPTTSTTAWLLDDYCIWECFIGIAWCCFTCVNYYLGMTKIIILGYTKIVSLV